MNTEPASRVSSLANPRRTRLVRSANPAVRLMINTVRPYEWGSRHVLARLQGRTPGASPEAELWLGAHPSAPSRLLSADGDHHSLPEAIAADPLGTLGPQVLARFGARLPFLMKVLAIERALSIQVHPSREQAEAGFARQGGPDTAPLTEPVYVDAFPKPELLYAVTSVQALAGLREPRRAGYLLDLLDSPRVSTVRRALAEVQSATPGEGTLGAVVALATWRLDDREHLVTEIARSARRALAHPRTERDPDALHAMLWVVRLSEQHRADPLVLAPLLMHLHTLRPGETIFLPAGVPHAYLEGTAVEIMAASDNVVRAGLTSKRVDPEAVAALTDARAQPQLRTGPWLLSDREAAWRPPVEEFQLIRATVSAGESLALTLVTGPEIILCLNGDVTVGTRTGRISLTGGESAFLRADDPALRLSGDGDVFRAAVAVTAPTGVGAVTAVGAVTSDLVAAEKL